MLPRCDGTEDKQCVQQRTGVGRELIQFAAYTVDTSSQRSRDDIPPDRDLGEDLGGVIFGCTNDTLAGARFCLLRSRSLRADAARWCQSASPAACLVRDAASFGASRRRTPHRLHIAGLPRRHFSYVENIEPGSACSASLIFRTKHADERASASAVPLFLFNVRCRALLSWLLGALLTLLCPQYKDRMMHGIFQADSSGALDINPHGWTGGTTQRTAYPAQGAWRGETRSRAGLFGRPLTRTFAVRVSVFGGRRSTLPESLFGPVIAGAPAARRRALSRYVRCVLTFSRPPFLPESYYSSRLFHFELTRAEAAALCKLFRERSGGSLSVPPSRSPSHSAQAPAPRTPPPSVVGAAAPAASAWAQKAAAGGAAAAAQQQYEKQYAQQYPQQHEQQQREQQQREQAAAAAAAAAAARAQQEAAASAAAVAAATASAAAAAAAARQEADRKDAAARGEAFRAAAQRRAVERAAAEAVSRAAAAAAAAAAEQNRAADNAAAAAAAAATAGQQLVVRAAASSPAPAPPSSALVPRSAPPREVISQESLLALAVHRATFAASSFSTTHSDASAAIGAHLEAVSSALSNLRTMDAARAREVADLRGEVRSQVALLRRIVGLDPPPSVSATRLFAAGGFDGASWLDGLDVLTPSAGAWAPASKLPSPRGYSCLVGTRPAGAASQGTLYLLGGGDGAQNHRTTSRYDIASSVWTHLRPMASPRGSFAAVAMVDGTVLAAGGSDSSTPGSSSAGPAASCYLRTAEVYSPGVDAWAPTPQMFETRFCPGGALLRGSAYVIGGFDGERYLHSIERYGAREVTLYFTRVLTRGVSFPPFQPDPREGRWTGGAPMSSRRGSLGLVAFGDSLFAAGGFNGTNFSDTCEMFGASCCARSSFRILLTYCSEPDTRANAWRPAASLSHPRAYVGLSVVDNKLVLVGGLDGLTHCCDIEVWPNRRRVEHPGARIAAAGGQPQARVRRVLLRGGRGGVGKRKGGAKTWLRRDARPGGEGSVHRDSRGTGHTRSQAQQSLR